MSTYTTRVQWEKFNTEADVEKLLQAHGWKRGRQRDERIDYVRPGKDERDGISGNYHTGKHLFYVFTDATEFAPDRAYNAVQVFCILECGGKMKDAARKLEALGYVEKIQSSRITGKVHLEI